MKFRLLLGLALVAVPLSAAAAMPVSTFLAKAEKKGPLAMFSGDLKLLAKQVRADAAQIREERLAAKTAGKRTAFCPPSGGAKLTDKDILAAMEAVPAAERSRTSTKDALRAFLARHHPCPTA